MTSREAQTDRFVRAFYERSHMDPGAAARLAALAEVDRNPPSSVRPPSRVRVRNALIAAALLVLTATASYQYLPPLGESNSNRSAPHIAPYQDVRLVALRFQVDWCPKSQATEPVFKDLVMKYGNAPLQFAVYNMTNANEEMKSKEMARRIGVDWVRPVPTNSGKVFLVDPDRRLIYATLSTPNDRDRWMVVLDRELERQH